MQKTRKESCPPFTSKTRATLNNMTQKQLHTLIKAHDKTFKKLVTLNHLSTPAYNKMSSSKFKSWSKGFHERDRLLLKIDKERALALDIASKKYWDDRKTDPEYADFFAKRKHL